MKRAGMCVRVSTIDQHLRTQLFNLRDRAAQRGFEIVKEYTDQVSEAKRQGLDQLLSDALWGKFDIVLVWDFDRIAVRCGSSVCRGHGFRRPEPVSKTLGCGPAAGSQSRFRSGNTPLNPCRL